MKHPEPKKTSLKIANTLRAKAALGPNANAAQKIVAYTLREIGFNIRNLRIPEDLYTNKTFLKRLVDHVKVIKRSQDPTQVKRSFRNVVNMVGGMSMVATSRENMIQKLYAKHRQPVNYGPFSNRNTILTPSNNVRNKIAEFNSVRRGQLVGMLVPLGGKGGVRPGYYFSAANKNLNPIAYGIVPKNGTKVVKAFAFLRNMNGGAYRYLNLIAAAPVNRGGYGSALLKKILENAKNRPVHLKAVNGVANFYRRFGFVNNGPKNQEGLQPMKRVVA
jgi:hypothetical protein